MRSMNFKQRFLLLGAVFVLGYVALLLVGRATMLPVTVHGEVYDDLAASRALIADVAPPALFVVQPYAIVHQLVHTRDPAEREKLKKDFAYKAEQYRERFQERLAVVENPTIRRHLEDADEHAERFFDVVQTALFPVLESAEKNAVLDERIIPAYREHRTAAERAASVARKNVTDREEEAREAVGDAKLWLLVTAVAFILVVGGIGLYIMRSILRALRALIERMRAMAEGEADLSRRVRAQGDDETAELAHWVNAFLDKIAMLVRAAQRSSVQLTSTATQVAATSRQQEETVQDFGASTNQIAAAVKEITATSAELTGTMQEVGEVARGAARIAADGRTSLDDMEGAMEALAGSSASISSKLSVINEKASDITVVVTTITKVADQTNLLSVNAAIEAEKAGEYGRGFLVVSREIRRLADQTASATLDIEETVKQMQSAVSAGVMEMDKFTDQVRRSVDEVKGIGERLGHIIESVELLVDRFGSVQEGMESQDQGARQIGEAMGSLSESVRDTVGSLGEFTSAAEEMRASVEDLKQELEKFRLDGA